MRRAKFWQAFTETGIKFIAKQKLNKVQYQTILYISYAMNEENIVTIPKKSELLKAINAVFELDPPIKNQNFYKNFKKLEDLYIIRKTEGNIIPGYMMNPFITYKTGLRNYSTLINWLNLVDAKPTEPSKNQVDWIPENGFKINGKQMEPYDPRLFGIKDELAALDGYKYKDIFEEKEKPNQSDSFFSEIDKEHIFNAMKK